MKYLLLLSLLFVGCQTRNKAKEVKKAPQIINNTVDKLVDIIHNIGTETDKIEAESILIDEKAGSISDTSTRDSIKRSSNNISNSNNVIKTQNKALSEKINPQLKQAKEASERTEKVNKELEEFIDSPAHKFITYLLYASILALPVCFFIGIKIPTLKDEMELGALTAVISILCCICITWLFSHKEIVVAVAGFLLLVLLLRFLFKRHKALRINDDIEEDEEVES